MYRLIIICGMIAFFISINCKYGKLCLVWLFCVNSQGRSSFHVFGSSFFLLMVCSLILFDYNM
jgi:hypothetical protein